MRFEQWMAYREQNAGHAGYGIVDAHLVQGQTLERHNHQAVQWEKSLKSGEINEKTCNHKME
jgi:hypothetical protein